MLQQLKINRPIELTVMTLHIDINYIIEKHNSSVDITLYRIISCYFIKIVNILKITHIMSLIREIVVRFGLSFI
jgi:aromatic ring-opening dioxygenase LigB subunit